MLYIFKTSLIVLLSAKLPYKSLIYEQDISRSMNYFMLDGLKLSNLIFHWQNAIADLAEVILQCGLPLHHRSDTLK